jgi:hypothetical protein
LREGTVEALDQLNLSLLLLGLVEKVDAVLTVGLVRGDDGMRFV